MLTSHYPLSTTHTHTHTRRYERQKHREALEAQAETQDDKEVARVSFRHMLEEGLRCTKVSVYCVYV
jgi:hypothetical protein